MKQYTVRYTFMISENQNISLSILKKYDVNIAQFIRQAIKEKLAKDWRTIKERKGKVKLPF